MIRLPRNLGGHIAVGLMSLLLLTVPVAAATAYVPSGGGGPQPSPAEEAAPETVEVAPSPTSFETPAPDTSGTADSTTQSPTPEPTAVTPAPTATPAQEPASNETEQESLVSVQTNDRTWVWVLLGIGVVLALGLVGFAFTRRRSEHPDSFTPQASSGQRKTTATGEQPDSPGAVADDSWAKLTDSEREAFRRTAEEFGWS
jgi:hypothetical protein